MKATTSYNSKLFALLAMAALMVFLATGKAQADSDSLEVSEEYTSEELSQNTLEEEQPEAEEAVVVPDHSEEY